MQGRRVKAAATAAGAKAAAKAAAKRAAAVVDADLARLAAAASEKWHNVQHLAHRWACIGTREVVAYGRLGAIVHSISVWGCCRKYLAR